MQQQTSLSAYREILPQLGERQAQVYSIIKHNVGRTDLEIARKISRPINSVTPRRNELVKLGLVETMGVVTSPVTGRKVNSWRARQQ